MRSLRRRTDAVVKPADKGGALVVWARPRYGYVEQQSREQYTGFIPQLHKRHIDDVVAVVSCRREELEAFIDFVSNFHPALQFTLTVTETELPFLDINLHTSEDRIQTSVFYKETDTHSCLHFSSFHPDHCKCVIPYSQFLRLRQLCSDNDDFLIKSREMHNNILYTAWLSVYFASTQST